MRRWCLGFNDGGTNHRERVSQKAHRGLAELSHSDSSVLLVPPRAALGLLCYVLIDYSVRLLVPSYVQIKSFTHSSPELRSMLYTSIDTPPLKAERGS